MTDLNYIHIRALNLELDWLEEVIRQVIASYLKHEGHEKHWKTIPVPIHQDESAYSKIITDWQLNEDERLALALAMAPHVRPEALDIFFGTNARTERSFTEFGGVTEKGFNGFLPTGQTFVFLICANDPEWREHVMRILSPSHRFSKEQVLALERSDERLPPLSGAMILSERWQHYFLTGEMVQPELSAAFPASPIHTPLAWADLVLDHQVRDQIDEIFAWLRYGNALMEQGGLDSKVKPGYRALFHGAPGTGKTLTASLLGKSTGRDVYRVDLSMIVSKWIGETEKNLGKIFDAASYKDWILFFDEADALFGKRTSATTSNDRHANQQTGYLLQRIEDFPGTVILSTNLKANMDEAFTRRFQAMIHFTIPNAVQREQLWRNAFNGVCKLDVDIDLGRISQDYEIAGGSIINVLRHCALRAWQRPEKLVSQEMLLEGIRREFKKENRTL